MRKTAGKNKLAHNRRIAAGCLLCLSGALFMTGCSVFEPREPQPPGSGTQGTTFIEPNDASGVFTNLESGIEDLLDGGNYKRSLSENFDFVPLVDDQVDLGDEVYADWNKQVEENVLDFIISGADTIKVDFNPAKVRDESDYVQFRVDYHLRFVPSAGGVEIYRGVAEFDIRRINGRWVLGLWREIEAAGEYQTWGYLKGLTRRQIEN